MRLYLIPLAMNLDVSASDQGLERMPDFRDRLEGRRGEVSVPQRHGFRNAAGTQPVP